MQGYGLSQDDSKKFLQFFLADDFCNPSIYLTLPDKNGEIIRDAIGSALDVIEKKVDNKQAGHAVAQIERALDVCVQAIADSI
jgi:hypothetical protein